MDRNAIIPVQKGTCSSVPDHESCRAIGGSGLSHRVPGTVIYACPGERLLIHVLNADVNPHSFHVQWAQVRHLVRRIMAVRDPEHGRPSLGRDLHRPDVDVRLRRHQRVAGGLGPSTTAAGAWGRMSTEGSLPGSSCFRSTSTTSSRRRKFRPLPVACWARSSRLGRRSVLWSGPDTGHGGHGQGHRGHGQGSGGAGHGGMLGAGHAGHVTAAASHIAMGARPGSVSTRGHHGHDGEHGHERPVDFGELVNEGRRTGRFSAASATPSPSVSALATSATLAVS